MDNDKVNVPAGIDNRPAWASITGFILGVVGFFTLFLGIGLILSIIGIIFGIIGLMRRQKLAGLAITAVILGILSFLGFIFIWLIFGAAIMAGI